MRATVFILLLCLPPWSAAGSGFEAVLVPIVAYDVPGAFGSVWNTHLVVHNGTDRVVSFDEDIVGVNLVCVDIPCVQPPPLLPGQSAEIRPDIIHAGFVPTRLLYLRSELKQRVTFQLRVQDKSRALETWGTSIPVDNEADFVDGKITLLDIPMTGPFRQSLRIYAASRVSTDCEVFDLRVFELETGSTLATLDAVLTDATGHGCESPNLWPNSAEIHNLSGLIPPPAPARAGIEISPRSPGLRYWALVTVTNDETQHVTAITPGGNVRDQ